jgi:hypothetical protein
MSRSFSFFFLFFPMADPERDALIAQYIHNGYSRTFEDAVAAADRFLAPQRRKASRHAPKKTKQEEFKWFRMAAIGGGTDSSARDYHHGAGTSRNAHCLSIS